MWGTLVGGAALGSALIGADASRGAANTITDAAGRSANTQAQASSTARADLAPFRAGGAEALKRLMFLSGMGDPNALSRDDAAVKAGLKAPTWDDAAAAHLDSHMKTFGTGYTAGSDMAAAQRQTQGILDKMTAEYNAKVDALAPAGGGSTDAGFGSLTKPFTLQDFQADPGYAFRVSEGEKALTRASAASGVASGSPGLKSLMRYSSDLASQEYGNAFSRDLATKQNTSGLLMSMAGMGQNAAAQTGSLGVNAASGVSNSLLMGGQAQAAGITGVASSMNNALQGGLSNYMYQQRYDDLMKRMPVFSGGGTTTTSTKLPGMD